VEDLETTNRGCQSQSCNEPVHIFKFRVFRQVSRKVSFSVSSPAPGRADRKLMEWSAAFYENPYPEALGLSIIALNRR
jgi:hypothetical protein